MSDLGDLMGKTAGDRMCCNRAEVLWGEDDLMQAVLRDAPLPTDVIDQLPPWRAKMVVTVCLKAGATLQHGTPEQFDKAADAAGLADSRARGWWRQALGLEPVDYPDPPGRPPARLPTGWRWGNWPKKF